MKKLKITLKKSKYNRKPNHRECVEGLGLRKIGQTVLRPDTPQVRGLVNKVRHLIEVAGS